MTAIAVTTAALIIILSTMNGITGVVANIYNAFEPDLKITALKGKSFHANSDLLNKVKSIDGVQLVSRTITDKALIKNGDNQVLVTVKGIDENYHLITGMDSAVTEGNFDLHKDAKGSILLGGGIAGKLQTGIHEYASELSLFSPVRGKSQSLNPQDNLNQIFLTPTGIFSLNDEFDHQLVFVNLETASKLFEMSEQVSALEIGCEKGEESRIQEELEQLLGEKYIVKNRYQLNDTLFKTLETEKLATFIILAFVLIIATFNIIGALTMLIIEKKKDIKTLHAMGAGLDLVRNIFMREGLLITGIGAASGLIIGLVVCLLQIQFHLVSFGDDTIIPYYPVELKLSDFIKIFLLIMVIGFVAALYPVRVFTRKDLLVN